MEKRRAQEGPSKTRRMVVDRWRAVGDDSAPDGEEMQRLGHELQLRQIQLERRNEELRRARAETEDWEARYTQLQLQLEESQKLQSIGTFAGGIAHDLNNIFTGLLGGLSMLAIRLDPDDKSRVNVRDMTELVHSASDLAKHLLDFDYRAKRELGPLNVARAVAKTSAMFGRTRREIEFRLAFPAGLMAAIMDSAQFGRVLLNLLLNAAQAMPHGGQIHLGAENVELDDSDVAPFGAESGRFVKLVVTDSGVGMDAATQARIFEPFFTTKGPGLGTGLGLASVNGILRSHGGFITVVSALGQGTTFSIFLPAADLPAPEQKTPAAALVRGSGTVLVVDDEPQVLQALTLLLGSIGYDVLTASSGREAVAIVRRSGLAISLVILDVVMPEMSGSQTYSALRKVAPGIKVLLSSGYGTEVRTVERLAQGCQGFIQKPFDAATLSAKLGKILDSNSVATRHL